MFFVTFLLNETQFLRFTTRFLIFCCTFARLFRFLKAFDFFVLYFNIKFTFVTKMKNNSVTIGVVMCIVCCVGALCIPSLFNTSSDMSSGWNPSNVYSDVITTDNNVFTEAELQSSPSMGTSITRVSTSSTRLFHHSPSAIAVSNWVQTSSSSNATNYTASSNANISKGATPSAGIYTSTGNQSSAQAGATSVISSSSLATSSLSNHSPLSANSSSATTRTTVAAASAYSAPAVSSKSMFTSMPMAQMLSYASAASSFSGLGGLSGRLNAPGMGNPYAEWLLSLYNQENTEGGTNTPWLYNDDNGIYYFHYDELFEWFKTYYLGLDPGVTIPEDQMGDVMKQWEKFLKWFQNEHANKQFAFPLSDGVGVMIALAVLYILYLYYRTRKQTKKIA